MVKVAIGRGLGDRSVFGIPAGLAGRIHLGRRCTCDQPALRSWHGLYRIWFDLGATQQYYPLLHSVFWIEHKFWGDATLGYHLVNILLHAMAALMVAAVLRRLEVPGAYLAAAIFALHPVRVESVAWITELKNTLSAVFYLGAAMLYLRFDQERKKPYYAGALVLFVLGLLSKTVTATLPAALLVIFWWQRGRLSWKRDVLPLVPFFVLGAAAGLFTAWVERKLIGAEGAAFDLTFIERFLIAGRVIWFYLGKLFWPADLIFIYPRWHVNQAVWWQYLFPAAALLLAAVLWGLRRRWRGPLAGLLFFRWNAVPGAGFLQCVSLHLFVRGRSLSIPGESGDNCPGLGRDNAVAGAMGGFGVESAAMSCACCCCRPWRS